MGHLHLNHCGFGIGGVSIAISTWPMAAAVYAAADVILGGVSADMVWGLVCLQCWVICGCLSWRTTGFKRRAVCADLLCHAFFYSGSATDQFLAIMAHYGAWAAELLAHAQCNAVDARFAGRLAAPKLPHTEQSDYFSTVV